MRVAWTVLAALALVAGTAACGSDEPSAGTGGPSVVASTDVWGSVAGAVAGEHATVTSIVTGVAADPHSFEASPADAAAVADAALVVYNGGGYDHWVDEVLASNPDVPAVDAVSLTAGPEPKNEHVFYDLQTAAAVADRIAEDLAAADPANADAYRANAADFAARADTVAASQHAIGTAHPDASVVATEPVAHYLIANAGIADRTPPAFSAAVEQGDDPAPADVAAVLDLIDGRQVSALVVNRQTETPLTRQLEAAARKASVPVVAVTETLPEATDYLAWQADTVAELGRQLDRAARG